MGGWEVLEEISGVQDVIPAIGKGIECNPDEPLVEVANSVVSTYMVEKEM